ncbi:MAG TPA: winged helix-turn-helix domain-containing protein, partial [Pyrinomonadaceae bacterium]|nr:winged helix-turn-helix domain-containing protein [Pyrinomonadaceae bacterium]
MLPQALYEFGPFKIDTRERILLRDGQRIPLKPKAVDTLLVLIRNSGHIVEKEELMKEVWPDTFVEENNLTGNIFALRRAFAEHQYIETIPRRGYRFIADVKQVKVERAEPPRTLAAAPGLAAVDSSSSRRERGRNVWRIGLVPSLIAFTTVAVAAGVMLYRRGRQVERPASKPLAIKSIAILPFKPLGEESGDEFLSLGMADALITRLSNLQQLVVRPSSSIIRYTAPDQDPLEAGREQQVDAVLDGRIQRVEERVRVTVQLLRVQDRQQLWADKFDEKFTDIFALQDAISERVAAALALKLSSSEQDRIAKRYTENAEAYQLYLKGRYFWNRRTVESLQKGIEYFSQAVEKDSRYALAHAGLADSYIILGNFGLLPPTEAYPKAKIAAERALKVDPDLVEAQVSLAFVKSLFERDWPGAEAGFKRAIELNPNYGPAHQWYGVSLAGAGRLDEAVAEVRRAQQVDPQSLTISAVVGWMLYLARDYDKAIEQENIVLEMDENFALAHRYLGLAYEQKGMYVEAISEFQKARSLSGARPLDSAALAHAYAIGGRKGEARQILERVTDRSTQVYFPAQDIALIYVGLGEKDLAFDWLEKAFQERSPWLTHLRVDPRFDPLRS